MSKIELDAGVTTEVKARFLDHAKQSIIVTALDGRIVYWNTHATELYGWTADEAVGRSIVDVIVSEIDQAIAEDILAKLRAGKTWQGKFPVRRKDGSSFVAHVFDAPILDEQGELVGLIGVSDRADDDEAEDAVRELGERLDQFIQLEAVGRLAGGVAHDMNNILTSVMTYASLIRDPATTAADIAAHAAKIHELCQRGRQFSRNLLGFAQRGKQLDEDVDVRELLDRVVELVGPTMPATIRLQTELEPGPLLWRGDPVQLEQLIFNLCINAIDALEERGGQVNLRVVRDQLPGRDDAQASAPAYTSHVRLDVIDDGHGMPPTVLARAAEPFFTTRTRGYKLGLGLSMAYGTARAHDGRLELDSNPGRGTTVRVWIPGPEPSGVPGSAPAGPLAGVDASQASVAQSGPATVLVVDDEPSVRAAAMLVLETFGYRVITARDGREALTMFRAHEAEVGLVLLDLLMPVMAGPETYYALRELSERVPILLASGYSKGDTVAELIAAGALGLLEKPYDADQLVLAVREALTS